MGKVTEPIAIEVLNHDRLEALNKSIIRNANRSLAAKVISFRKMLEIAYGELWRADPTFRYMEEWLAYLEENRVEWAATSTFYNKLGIVAGMKSTYLKAGESEERAFDKAVEYAALHEGAFKALENGGAIEVKKLGRGMEAQYDVEITDKIEKLKDDPIAYLDNLSTMSSKKAIASVIHDSGKGGIWVVDALRANNEPEGVEWSPQIVVSNVIATRGNKETSHVVMVKFQENTPIWVKQAFIRKIKTTFEW